MSDKLFITATDTNVGKTYTALKLLKKFKQQGLQTLGIKPIASGCLQEKKQWINQDAILLRGASTIQLDYSLHNPFAFKEYIAPHIAASYSGIYLTIKNIIEKMQPALNFPADICLIEGVGGWHCPLNNTDTMAEVVKQLKLKTILVVGMRLGCLNQAILTYKALQQDGISIVGWIANCCDQTMQALDENVATLKNFLPIPLLEIIPYCAQL